MNHKPIRNRIRKYTYQSLQNELLIQLRHYEKQSRPMPYWHLLLLLRWAMEFAEQDRSAKIADQNVIRLLLEDLEQLELAHQTFNLTTNGRRINKTFIILSFQQMVYQERAWWDSFARQSILYENIKVNYDINASFERLTGNSIGDFLKMLWVYWMMMCNEDLLNFKTDEHTLVDIAAILAAKFSVSKVAEFLALLTVTKENIQQVIIEDKRLVKNYDLQIFETSVFTKKPILAVQDQPIVIYKSLLNTTANYFIYDYLKNRDDQFTTEFGARMERYVGQALNHIYAQVETEGQLRRKFGKTAKVVDFIVEEIALIEVKAIELKPHVGVNPTDENLAQEFKKNVVKAYAEQMLEVVENINKGVECFGIIVTYKNLHLGNSQDVWEQFLQEETIKLKTEEQISRLPITNLFFIDLHTWDQLMEVLQRKTINLVDLLKKVKATDSVSTTKKHTFAMHLDEYEIKDFTLPYLTDAKKRIQEFLQ